MTKKIAIPSDDRVHIAGHAGQARHWLIYDTAAPDAPPARIELDKPRVQPLVLARAVQWVGR